MKKSILLLVCLAIGAIGFAQTHVSKGQSVSGTWSPKNSPYIIDGEAYVEAGKTLKIKPGTEIKFRTGEERDYSSNYFDLGFLRVRGKLIAKGKADNMITFTRNGNNGNWGIVFFDKRSVGNQLVWCKFMYGYHIRNIISDDNGTGVVSFCAADGVVSHCVFVNNGWTAFNCKQSSSPTFTNNTLVYNKYGIECNTDSKPTILNTIVWDNETGFYINGGAMPTIGYSLIQDSYLPGDAKDGGKNIYNRDPLFKDKRLYDFNLQKTSPCLNAGKGGNIGAY